MVLDIFLSRCLISPASFETDAAWLDNLRLNDFVLGVALKASEEQRIKMTNKVFCIVYALKLSFFPKVKLEIIKAI